MPIVFYDSMREFFQSLPAQGYPRKGNTYSARGREAWSGSQTYKEAKENLYEGDPDALSASDRVLEQIEAAGIELPVPYWDTDRTGFIPCVPSFLAGAPESMRRLYETRTETAPIKIMTDVCLSAHFEANAVTKRGAAILALARKLQAVRPVELWLYASLFGTETDETGKCAIPVIRMDTNPMDLTTASYALGNPAFLRQICFAWGYPRGFEGSWAWDSGPLANRQRLTKHFDLKETDMLLDGAYATDQLMNEPLQWVNDQVQRFAHAVVEQD